MRQQPQASLLQRGVTGTLVGEPDDTTMRHRIHVELGRMGRDVSVAVMGPCVVTRQGLGHTMLAHAQAGRVRSGAVADRDTIIGGPNDPEPLDGLGIEIYRGERRGSGERPQDWKRGKAIGDA